MIERFQAVVTLKNGKVVENKEFETYNEAHQDVMSQYYWYWSRRSEFICPNPAISAQIIKLIYQQPKKRIMANIDFNDLEI